MITNAIVCENKMDSSSKNFVVGWMDGWMDGWMEEIPIPGAIPYIECRAIDRSV